MTSRGVTLTPRRSRYRAAGPAAVVALLALLSGCEYLPIEPGGVTAPKVETLDLSACHADIPSFAESECMLTDWVAFGLASQRGDREWRNTMLALLEGHAPEQRLGRAVVLAWGSEAQWNQASELYKADLSMAPSELQPLMRYWLNELEGRRALSQRAGRHHGELSRLREENQALADKLDALTAIEQNINLRQQTE
ncbi:hypothetical protein [Halomonas sp. DP8Y7-3]|uniref:hypothetical protein n=1 Tax=Halomonas sp. DP8Y7-3 TaxID=2859079 RepID=UPI0021BDD34D|nr:hypothetical protein [Halomonas sp. DP8Y7-3]